MEQTSARGIAGSLRGMAKRPDRRGDLAKISVPTLVLVGEDDVITPPAVAKSLADAIPGARLEVIAKAGHLAPYENPSVANAVILRFSEEPGGPSLMAEGTAERSSPRRHSSRSWSSICGRAAGLLSIPSLSRKTRSSRSSACCSSRRATGSR